MPRISCAAWGSARLTHCGPARLSWPARSRTAQRASTARGSTGCSGSRARACNRARTCGKSTFGFALAPDLSNVRRKGFSSPRMRMQGGFVMTLNRRTVAELGLMLPLSFVVQPASAEDQLEIAIGQINNWENQAPTLGQDAGIFKKHSVTLDAVGTQGAGETIQAVISGSADLGAGVGAAGVMRAFSKGAPVLILAPMFTGTQDLYWYVKSDSPIKTLKDATDSTTIAYSTNGSSSNNIVRAFVDELGAKAKPVATGGPPATPTALMSGPGSLAA